MRQNDVVDVVNRADQADAAHVSGLFADIERPGAHILIAVGNSGHHLTQGNLVGHQLLKINLHMVFLREAAPPYDIDHAGKGPELPFQNPVLKRFQVDETGSRRTDQLVAVDFSDGAFRRDRGLNSIREGHRVKPVGHLLKGKVVIRLVRKIHLDIGEPIKGNRADVH